MLPIAKPFKKNKNSFVIFIFILKKRNSIKFVGERKLCIIANIGMKRASFLHWYHNMGEYSSIYWLLLLHFAPCIWTKLLNLFIVLKFLFRSRLTPHFWLPLLFYRTIFWYIYETLSTSTIMRMQSVPKISILKYKFYIVAIVYSNWILHEVRELHCVMERIL